MKRKRTTSCDEPAVKYSDFGTQELRAKGKIGYTITPDGFSQAKRLQLAIDYYYSRGIVDDRQYLAAKRLLEDYRLSGLEPSIRSSLNMERGSNTNMTVVELQMDAKKRFDAIVWCILDHKERCVILWLVLDDASQRDLRQINKKLAYEAVSALRSGLDTVDKFYKTHRH